MWALLLVFVCAALLPDRGGGAWTGYDLVRPRLGATGSNGTVSFVKITSRSVCVEAATSSCQPLNITSLARGSNFGSAVANIGDLDGDGIDDLAVGAPGDTLDYGGDIGLQIAAGSIYIFFMHENATVRNYTRISGLDGNGPKTYANDQFGFSLAGMGDMDGDEIVDLAVGAPGYIIASAYLLHLFRNGTVKSATLIRGKYVGDVPSGLNQTSLTFNNTLESNYTFNGPPITYGNRFACALANVGDFNHDNITDLAVGQVDTRTGKSAVYLLFLNGNGSVQYYTTISSNTSAGLDYPNFSGFGSSILLLPDLNNDTIPELIVGAPTLYESGSLSPNAGTVFVLFMLANGSVNATEMISETRSRAQYGSRAVIPFVPYDECGSSLTTIGDINRDGYRQRRPEQVSLKRQGLSFPDLVMGCPQRRSSEGSGRLFFVFLTAQGYSQAQCSLPAESDSSVLGPSLDAYDQLGQALAAFHDVDRNGLAELVVGAPGDDSVDGEVDVGAVYILFPRRRRHHWIPYDYLTYILLVTLIPGIWCCLCCLCIMFFFWYFRRIPDEAEEIVKNSGMERGLPRPRTKYQRRGKVYAEHYTT